MRGGKLGINAPTYWSSMKRRRIVEDWEQIERRMEMVPYIHRRLSQL
jgi:hypothetical protein